MSQVGRENCNRPPTGSRNGLESKMELVVFITVLILLAGLVDRFGVDSRDTLRSHEAELADLGFTREQRAVLRQESSSR
jgi:hypothetical protein